MKLPFFPISATATRMIFSLHILVLLVCWSALARGATFLLPTDGSNIVGQVRVVVADSRNTLLDIARHFELGHEEITLANPGVSIWLPGAGTRIVVPTEFILPPPPWQGVVVNIPQRRLYYFPPPKAKQPASVITFPLGIARPGWPTPLGATRIVGKHKDPAWFVPKSIQAEQRSQGEPDFPEYFPPGPNNPMGMLALQTGFAQIFIHGTNRPWGVGMRVSHGCLHLYPEHAADLFPQVVVGTPVRFVNQPVLVGERDQQLYLSVFEAVDGYPDDPRSPLVQAMDLLLTYDAPIDWKRVEQVVDARRGMPVPVNAGAPGLDDLLAVIQAEPYVFEPYGIEANDAMPPDETRGPEPADAPAP
jgi:L,D-transpeptidase ErfK/SrfK